VVRGEGSPRARAVTTQEGEGEDMSKKTNTVVTIRPPAFEAAVFTF